MNRFLATAALAFMLALVVAPSALAQGSSLGQVQPTQTSGSSLGQVQPTAQTQTSSGNTTFYNPLGATTLSVFVTDVLKLITTTVGPIIVILMLVYTGFKFVWAQGKEEEIKKAREMLLWTIVGALILLGAVAISQGLQATVSGLSSS